MRGTKLPTTAFASSVQVRIARAERDIRMLYRRVIVPMGLYEIKVWADAIEIGPTNGIGDARFVFEIPYDLSQHHLKVARAFLSTAGSSDTEVMIRNIDNGNSDMLTSPIVVPTGSRSSRSSDSDGVVDDDNSIVMDTDQIAIDVDANPADSAGLGVILRFS